MQARSQTCRFACGFTCSLYEVVTVALEVVLALIVVVVVLLFLLYE